MNEINRNYEKRKKKNYCYNISNEPASTISQSSSFSSESDSQNLFNIKMKSNRNYIPYNNQIWNNVRHRMNVLRLYANHMGHHHPRYHACTTQHSIALHSTTRNTTHKMQAQIMMIHNKLNNNNSNINSKKNRISFCQAYKIHCNNVTYM